MLFKNALEKCSRPNFRTNWGGNKIRIQYDETEKKNNTYIYLEKPHLFFENRERERKGKGQKVVLQSRPTSVSSDFVTFGGI